MGNSGDAASDGSESESDSDGGSFEFGVVEEDQEGVDQEQNGADLSDAVDFSLDKEAADFGDGSGNGSSGAPDSRNGTRTSAETSAAAAKTREKKPAAGTNGGAGTSESGTSSSEPGTSATNTESGAEQSSPSSSGTVSSAAASGGGGSGGSDSTQGSAGDSGGGDFYEIDPVDESQKAFDFAEKQSKAAYEFAYKEATQNPMARVLKKYTSHKVRKRLEQVFSRRMLGSVFIGMSFTNIINVSVHAYLRKNSAVPWWEPLIWLVVFWSAVAVFVWWERLARKASEAATQAAASASEAAESASEAAESASQKAEAATEAASQAAETATETATGGGEEKRRTKASKPTTLDGKGQTAGSYATDEAGHRGTPARRRAPDRRPNKRFGDSTTQERLSSFEDGCAGEQGAAEEFEQVNFEELPQQGGGFKNAGERGPPGSHPSADGAGDD